MQSVRAVTLKSEEQNASSIELKIANAVPQNVVDFSQLFLLGIALA